MTGLERAKQLIAEEREQQTGVLDLGNLGLSALPDELFKNNLDAVGNEVFKKYLVIDKFAQNTSDMLEYLVDKLEPRDFDGMSDFGWLVAQIGGEPTQP